MRFIALHLRAFFTLTAIAASVSLFAQCDNPIQGNNNTFIPDDQFDNLFLESDEYGLVAVIAGNTYEFSTCDADGSDVWWDNTLTLRSTSGDLLAFNDDFCGSQAFISWVATFTGEVEIHLNRFGDCSSSPNWADGDVMIREIETVDCSPISMEIYQDDCEVTESGTFPVIGFDFTINGSCGVTEFCEREDGGDWVCYDLIALGVSVDDATDLLLSGTTPGAEYEFYFTTSDGTVSSTYTWTNGTCECVDVTFRIDTDCWGGETSWDLLDENGNIIDFINGGTLADESTTTWTYCLPEGCYDWVVYDSYGDGVFGSQYQECTTDGDYAVTDGNGNLLVDMTNADFGFSITETFCVTVDVPGCTDSNASNYDASATTDDGSCSYTWYSVASGDAEAAIWNPDPNSTTGLSAVFGEQSSFAVRNGQTVSISNELVANDFTVEDNNGAGDLQFMADVMIDLYGDLTVSGGTVDSSQGGFVLMGSSVQSINSDVALNDITIANGNGVVLGSALDLRGRLLINSGDFTATPYLVTLISDATRTASIGEIVPGSSFVGEVTLQRYIPSGMQNWVNLGNAITGKTLADWNDDIITSGFPNSQYPDYDFNNIFHYDETNPGLLNDGWEGAENLSDALDHQRGYMVYMTGSSQNVDVTGQIQQGDISVPLNYSSTGVSENDGWELVANVYPSEVDFEALHDASSNISATYYVYDAEASAYRTYTADLGVGTGSQFIASSQSFWVQTTGSNASLEWRENQKSNDGVSFERSNTEPSVITFSLSDADTYAESYLVFEENSATAFEPGIDAVHLGSMDVTAPEMALMAASGQKLVVDRRPFSASESSIPVHFEINTPQTVTFNVESIENVDDLTCLLIEDLFTGEIVPLEAGSAIELTFEESFNDVRLMIHHISPHEATSMPPHCEGEATGSIQIEATTVELNATLSNAEGTDLFTGNISGLQVIDGLEAGSYALTIVDAAGLCSPVTSAITVTEALEPNVIAGVMPAECNTEGAGTVVFEMMGDGDFSIEVTDENDNLIDSFEGAATAYEVGGLDPENYTAWVTTACNTSMQSFSLSDDSAVEIEVAYNEEIAFSEGNAVIEASAFVDNASSWYWTVNGELVSTMGDLLYAVNEPGIYSIGVSAYNESCSEYVEFNVIVSETTSIASVGLSAFSVYNNSSTLTFDTPDLDSPHLVKLYDVRGRSVIEFQLSAGPARKEVRELSQLSNGAYVVEIMNGQERFQQKILVQH